MEIMEVIVGEDAVRPGFYWRRDVNDHWHGPYWWRWSALLAAVMS